MAHSYYPKKLNDYISLCRHAIADCMLILMELAEFKIRLLPAGNCGKKWFQNLRSGSRAPPKFGGISLLDFFNYCVQQAQAAHGLLSTLKINN